MCIHACDNGSRGGEVFLATGITFHDHEHMITERFQRAPQFISYYSARSTKKICINLCKINSGQALCTDVQETSVS